MQQLSALDAMFLYMETPNTPMHIGGLSILDPSTASGGSVRFKDIIDRMVAMAPLAAYTRQRLVEVPMNLDFPYWIKDPHFDPEFHIRHIALPEPGDWRQLCILAARIFSRQLDRQRPLWEMYVIEGLDRVEGVPPGSFALLTKIHHAAIDGRSGADIFAALSDLAPEMRPAPEDNWKADKVPTGMQLLRRAGLTTLKKPKELVDFVGDAAPNLLNYARKLLKGELQRGGDVPRTRFNAKPSPHRVINAEVFALDDIRWIKSVAGCTVNDVCLAICGGALRRYLDAKGELPDDPLVSMCPINTREGAGAASGGNQVGTMAVSLETDEADPWQRLLNIAGNTRNSKAVADAIGADTMADVMQLTGASLAGLGARVATANMFVTRAAPIFNAVTTNVPGPQVPLYMFGARVVRSFGLGPATDGIGLFHAMTSYNGELAITITACRSMLPDPDFYGQCLRDAYSELYAAAQAQGAKADAASKRRTTAKKKASKSATSKTRKPAKPATVKAGG